MDDTNTDLYQKFRNNTSFSLFAFAADPSESVVGEYDLGSVFGIYMANAISTADVVGDESGVLTTEVAFSADGGTSGNENQMTLGFV